MISRKRLVIVVLSLLAGVLFLAQVLVTTPNVWGEQNDPDPPGSPGAVTKALDPKLYALYRPYIEREMDIACDTCFGPEVNHQLRAFRATKRPPQDVEYIVEVLQRESSKQSPNWDLLTIALKAAEFGMADDPRISPVCMEVLERVPNMPEDRLDAARNAAAVLASYPSSTNLEFLTAMLHPESIASANDEITDERRRLGYFIVGCIAYHPPADVALKALAKVIQTLEPKVPAENPELSYIGLIVDSAERRMEQLQSDLDSQ